MNDWIVASIVVRLEPQITIGLLTDHRRRSLENPGSEDQAGWTQPGTGGDGLGGVALERVHHQREPALAAAPGWVLSSSAASASSSAWAASAESAW
jgi:hypothetical protein